MNPKTVNDLDPKLKEAYERIMGTNFTPDMTQAHPQTSEAKPEPKPETQNKPLMQAQPVVNQPTTETPAAPAPKIPDAPFSVFTQSPSSSTKTEKKKINVVPLVLIIGGIIFFVIYVVIWAIIFGAIKLP